MPRPVFSTAIRRSRTVGASNILQEREACDVGSIAYHEISGRRFVDLGGMLIGVPLADETRMAFHALHTHDGRDVGLGRGLNLHNSSLALAR